MVTIRVAQLAGFGWAAWTAAAQNPTASMQARTPFAMPEG